MERQLFENESIDIGSGKLEFLSTRVQTLNCWMKDRARGVVYPKGATDPRGRVVMELEKGSTICRVNGGAWQPGHPNVEFVVNNVRIYVRGVVDPVFGMKATRTGSLIQVKKGAVRVGALGPGGTTVTANHGVSAVATGAGRVTAVANNGFDPALKPELCALTPDISLTTVPPAAGAQAGGDPLGLAADASGNIWFTDDKTPSIGLYDLAGNTISYPSYAALPAQPAGEVPEFIAADTSGHIWIAVDGPSPEIRMIDPENRTSTDYPLSAGSVPWAPAWDPVHEVLWFTDHSGAIGEVDPSAPAGQQVTEYGTYRGSHPQGIAVDPKGNVWFTDDSDSSPAIGMIDHSTIEARAPKVVEYGRSAGLVPGSLPRGIAVDPSGNVWFADERTADHTAGALYDGLIGMISAADPGHAISEYAIDSNGGNANSDPEGLVAYHGAVWFTDDGATKAIGRIDSTGAITESSKSMVPGSDPVGVVVANDVLWFTDRLDDAPRIGRLQTKPSCP
jgi:streptogramin lyase